MGCNHLSDCPRCGMIVEDLEDLVKDMKEEIKRLYDDLKAERIALERTVSRIKRSRDEWPLRSRWVQFTERGPEAEKTVLAREIVGKTIGSIYAEDDECWTDPAWVFNGEFYMREQELENWEWLEVVEAVTPEQSSDANALLGTWPGRDDDGFESDIDELRHGSAERKGGEE